MKNQFKKYIEFQEMIEKQGNLYVPENFDWVKDFILPQTDLELPSIERKSTIMTVMDKVNPIYIQLKDGSKLFFTYDEFKRISGVPVIGKTLIWKMQRLPQDISIYPSKITMCKVI
jgi:hypothetical protein